MTRRPVLPGASELFRRTDTAPAAPEVTELPNLGTTTSSPALRGGAAARSCTVEREGAVRLARYARSERAPPPIRTSCTRPNPALTSAG